MVFYRWSNSLEIAIFGTFSFITGVVYSFSSEREFKPDFYCPADFNSICLRSTFISICIFALSFFNCVISSL